MVDWAMHAKQNRQGDRVLERFMNTDNGPTARVIDSYQPRVEDVVQKVVVTAFTVQSG